MTRRQGDLFPGQKSARQLEIEQSVALSAMRRNELKLEEWALREIDRAFGVLLARGKPFTAEHLYRECNGDTRIVLDYRNAVTRRWNRNYLGNVFKQAKRAGMIQKNGRECPAVHEGSRGRMIPYWVPTGKAA